jgi:hypothetical protein
MRKIFILVRGNDKDFTVKLAIGGVPINIENVDIACEVKDAPGGNLLFTAIVTKTEPLNGVFRVRFPKEATANLVPNRRVYFDFMLTFPDGTVKNYPSPPYEALVLERVTD